MYQWLQTQSNQAEGNPEIKAVIDSELKKVSSQMAQLIEQEKQTQSLAEGLADTQQIDSNLKKLKALKVELGELDKKIKKSESNSLTDGQTDLKIKTESLIKKLETLEKRITDIGEKPELRFGVELYN